MSPRAVLVTGATQGLGFALAEGLAARLGPADVVYLTGRTGERVATAADSLTGAQAQVRPVPLDVADGAAVDEAAASIAREHGGIDIVFSNAYHRVQPGDHPAEVIGDYVEVNNLGTTRMLRAFGPLMRPGGRLMVVASSVGTLRYLPPILHGRFADLGSLDEVDHSVLAWRDAVRDGSALAEAWPAFLNIPSKVGQVAAIRTLAAIRRAEDERRNILLAAVCPGMIDTAASRAWYDMSAAQSPAQAAAPLLDLVLEPETDFAMYGELIRFGQVLPWVGEFAGPGPRARATR